ncbi:S-methyl-5'-thioadenosine phosphorylase [Gordonia sp. CPCC 205515]|uniref:S-methyl-5'-thioadenosine phosphorylase n=1 Tax=Gordonia sp. CPCC 205515 TaxID=3140791 RepID=UPI003AF3F633
MLTDNHTSDAAIGIIGGSGFYRWLADSAADTDLDTRAVTTPFGDPSAEVTVGTVSGRRIVFLPRHGTAHEYLPHEIPYRANLWALRSLGVRAIVAASAVGSLRSDVAPGSIVVPDQLVDRTSGRAQTYFDRTGFAAGMPGPVHTAFADPYCARLRSALTASGTDVQDGGTMVVIDGPRFSTRAESQWYARQGWSLINMTGHPEAVLARELQMCYATACLVTDLDAGVASGDGVTADEVFARFARHLPELIAVLEESVGHIDPGTTCDCAQADYDVDALLGVPA